jgi:hypothetical protein
MPDKVFLTAPIAKTVETPDGGREVWGFATLERVDKTGEIADFEGTVKAFEKWSSETEKRTQGKSKGNVRLMHGSTPAGKAIHWEPTETTVEDDNGNPQTVKAIWTGAYVPPTKPDIIKDIDEGILSAFSIGGSYAKRWWDDTSKAFRYIPELSEYSLVDNPAVPGADITQVIAKADGPWNKSERNIGGENVNGEVEKKAPVGSYEELQSLLNAALTRRFGRDGWYDGYLVATWPDKIIVYFYNEGKYFEIPYEMDADGDVTFGAQTEVEQEFVPSSAQKMVKATEDERKKLHDEAEARAKKYGISFKESKGHLTPPKGKPTDPEEYGDPTNYAYPIDSDNIHAAVSYFNQDGQREDGGYSEEEWSIIGKRIAHAAGDGYSFKDGKIETPSNGGKETQKDVTAEDLVKALIADAMKAAKGEKVGGRKWEEYDKDTLTKAASLLEKAIEQVDEIAKREQTEANAGDKGDQSDADVLKAAKEVLQHIVAEVKKVAAGEGQEATTADDDTTPGADDKTKDDNGKTEKGATQQDLNKAGAAISKSRGAHLMHAKNHIEAAMNGNDYTAADHDAWEQQMKSQESNNVEQETDAEKSLVGVLWKFIEANAQQQAPSVNLEGLAKADDLGKAIEVITGVAKSLETVLSRMDDLEKRLQAIEEQPVQGGPISNPDTVVQRFMKQTPDTAAIERGVLEKMRDDPSVPLSVRQEISKNLAFQSHPLAK